MKCNRCGTEIGAASSCPNCGWSETGSGFLLFPRILVVDDNQDAAELLANLLRLSTKCEVRTCSTSSECVQCAIEFHPHLILLDIGMPHPNGFEIGEELRRLGMPCQLFAISGLPVEKIRSKCAEIGFDGFLAKPVRIAEIRQIIETIRQRISSNAVTD